MKVEWFTCLLKSVKRSVVGIGTIFSSKITKKSKNNGNPSRAQRNVRFRPNPVTIYRDIPLPLLPHRAPGCECPPKNQCHYHYQREPNPMHSPVPLPQPFRCDPADLKKSNESNAINFFLLDDCYSWKFPRKILHHFFWKDPPHNWLA